MKIDSKVIWKGVSLVLTVGGFLVSNIVSKNEKAELKAEMKKEVLKELKNNN